VRLLPDSVAIIVVGNKYNRNIYHAKELANLFGAYDGAGSEEDENENSKMSDILMPAKTDSLALNKNKTSAKTIPHHRKTRSKRKSKKH
jgi:hypothetical protein